MPPENDGDYNVERRVDLDVERSLSEGPFSYFHSRGILFFEHTDAWREEEPLTDSEYR